MVSIRPTFPQVLFVCARPKLWGVSIPSWLGVNKAKPKCASPPFSRRESRCIKMVRCLDEPTLPTSRPDPARMNHRVPHPPSSRPPRCRARLRASSYDVSEPKRACGDLAPRVLGLSGMPRTTDVTFSPTTSFAPPPRDSRLKLPNRRPPRPPRPRPVARPRRRFVPRRRPCPHRASTREEHEAKKRC